MLRNNFSLEERIELNRMFIRFLAVMLILCLIGIVLTIKLATSIERMPALEMGVAKVGEDLHVSPKIKPGATNFQADHWINQ